MINIIQLGSNTGKDHVTDFIEYYIDIIDKVLLVEALPQLADELRDNYKGYNTDISLVIVQYQIKMVQPIFTF